MNERGVLPGLIGGAKRWTLCGLARLYRRLFLRKVTVVAVTGSCGKTTAKELVAAVLSSRLRGAKNPGTCNTLYHVTRMLLRTSPSDDFLVQELSLVQGRTATAGDGVRFDVPLAVMRPDVSVVTNVGTDHLTAFGSVEAIAAEKGKLVAALPPTGVALLNADDARVLAMASSCAGRVITYGRSPAAMVRAESIECRWPNRMTFTVVHDGQRVPVETELCGTHWVSSVLAAISAGFAMGVPLSAAAEAVGKVAPIDGRMSPEADGGGVTFIRDDWKASFLSIPPCLEFIKDARARRKICVFGTISDYHGHPASRYLQVARQALAVSDFVFFVGPWASRCLRARRHPRDQSLRAFSTVDGLAHFLDEFLLPGDLVLLKGSGADDMSGIVSARRSNDRGQRPASAGNDDSDQSPSSSLEHARERKDSGQVIVGLGNPGDKYRNTPHNVGQKSLDMLARCLDASWSRHEDMHVARAEYRGRQVTLLKPLVPVNDTGPALLRLSAQFGFSPDHCVIICDDIDLPVGKIRQRLAGSGGGHRGIISIIDAFQSEAIRRVKIGVGRPDDGRSIAKHVLTPLRGGQLAAMNEACEEANRRVLGLITTWQRETPP